MSDLPTCEATRSAISSPESASGHSPCDSLDGATNDPSGPAHAPVSRSALHLSSIERPLRMRGTCGPSGSISSGSAALQMSLESRLRALTEVNGSTAFSLTWKAKSTPAGRRYLRQQARAQTTSDSAFTSLPTPCARDGKDISRSNAFLSQRRRHSPSLATRLLESGLPWQVITPIYCLAMNLPLHWNDCAPKGTVTRSTRKPPRCSLQQPMKL